ncbi:MAG: sigma-54-dependent Fis family transcriptional regulator [Deltaproteobacteria bacterium]|nr:sigma-54-dependent Fis family transcriptional regulator [Deltaproteobacteria bacterium]
MFPNILIVDDEIPILKTLAGILSDEGFEVETAQTGYEALKSIGQNYPDLVLLDIWMPGMDGIETLKEIRKDYPYLPVVLITGHGSVEAAVQAVKLGAYDFIEKPLSIDKVVVTINNALNFRRLEEEYRYLRKKTLEKHSITGQSQPVAQLMQQIHIASPTDAWVLITGENGTGKELVARTVHQLSNRSEYPLITVNCATMNSDWLAGEIFGYEKGSPAGRRRRGKLEMAHKGTLFFDDVGEMDMATQGKILKAIEGEAFSRVGGGRPQKADVRVIAATSKNLEDEIEKGNFREDLYHRLNVIPIKVPPLRERSEDVPVLFSAFLAEFASENGAEAKAVSPEALSVLTSYHWPGNVRELKNLAERLVITVEEDTIEPGHIPPPVNEARACLTADEIMRVEPLKEARKAFEKAYIQAALLRHENSPSAAAKALGIETKSLEKKLRGME